ncbi:hypothetical protein [Propionivibrio dicarboxylicus]|uniref:Uncharacterized protein n=1 Tax=Propionivibrio dicarboxylicus TaxID=83767 RepID=A0A1G8HXH0_9RHOO|nr:hypothetical protein [Propionivibrio dicarboxylicus]SDI11211.1 hypothetical protein SAMN05660652_02869 [Propionivibrio dicarboxylicus]
MDDKRLMRDSRHIMLPEIDLEGQRRLSVEKSVAAGAPESCDG